MAATISWIVAPMDVANTLGFSNSIGEGKQFCTNLRSGSTGLSSSNNRKLKGREPRWNFCSMNSEILHARLKFGTESSRKFLVLLGFNANVDGEVSPSSEQRVYDVVLKQAAFGKEHQISGGVQNLQMLNEAYKRCGEVCEEYAKTFYLGTMLMTPERRRAIWAIYVWCRRTDELVDGPNSLHITPTALDRWELRLEDLFSGHPYDMFDAALSDTVSKFHLDIQPFKDMIEGMRMDLVKSRYKNFDELYLYCYYVAGTVALMSVPVMGIAPDSHATFESVYSASLALGIANQLTNILRDVGEDARRGRIYLPQDELAQAGLSEEDIFAGMVTDRWRDFMKNQIKRARIFFKNSEKGVTELNPASRYPVWASLVLYRKILDEIEANDYDNFTKRAYVGKAKKMIALPVAYTRSVISGSRTSQTPQKHEETKVTATFSS